MSNELKSKAQHGFLCFNEDICCAHFAQAIRSWSGVSRVSERLSNTQSLHHHVLSVSPGFRFGNGHQLRIFTSA